MPLVTLKPLLQPRLSRRIAWLHHGKYLPLLLWLVLVFTYRPPHYLFGVSLFAGLVLFLILFVALSAWEQSLRRQFIREAVFPRFLGAKLREAYPQLTARDTELVLHGLRQFFMAHLRSNRQFVAMPSRVVDVAWHEFILHTRAYQQWCAHAFGALLHHTPAEVLGSSPRRNDGLRRTWFWACKEESIDPRQPGRLPLLFALDKKFAIAGGFSYVPDCSGIDRQSGDAYCGTSFGGCGGGSGGDSPGDATGFGGSDGGSAGSDGGSDSSCGGGCGGGGD